jgi:hypothetical protein
MPVTGSVIVRAGRRERDGRLSVESPGSIVEGVSDFMVRDSLDLMAESVDFVEMRRRLEADSGKTASSMSSTRDFRPEACERVGLLLLVVLFVAGEAGPEVSRALAERVTRRGLRASTVF